MQWTQDGTIRNALWIGGGQWAGKTTVAGLLTDRHHLVHYHYDYHDARGHEDRRVAARVRRARAAEEAATSGTARATESATTTTERPAQDGPKWRDVLETDWEAAWIGPTPAQMAESVLVGFPERFGWVLDDLRGIVTAHPVLVDGWGLRPELVAAITDPARMVVLAPTEPWRRRQATALPRARRIGHRVSDPELAARNRFERDRLITEDAVREARRHGIRVIEVDGTRTADAIADDVADHFRPFLPRRTQPRPTG
ncbi:hypothetical protein ODJ79_20765 [Actinoplanes sp. KI2]|uniref:hypothetical protein n=1 Tax=Actinoplanes sp. KI2 TaxID=2983315 RepID=UPI0021D57C49|nr:hypothetical protein [Actinoplanes sp. KI2]MCU7726166.1 hypothetical protein [Actinoplanes sp. KI2]